MRITLVIGLLLIVVTTCPAATWHVAQDGSGDFALIQDAIDAASPGDTIRIHAGRYTELTTGHDIWGDGTMFGDVHVVVNKDSLTIQGDGPGITIIGQETFPADAPDNYYGITASLYDAPTTIIKDLTVENCRRNIMSSGLQCNVINCHVLGFMNSGVQVFTPEGARIVDSVFEGNDIGVLGMWPAANVTILGCSFNECVDGVLFSSTTDVTIESCEFTNIREGMNFQQGTTALAVDCDIVDPQNIGVYVSLGAQVELVNCRIFGGQAGIHLTSGGAGHISASECFISGATFVCVSVHSGIIELNNSTIINGGEWSVICDSTPATDCRIDMTNNYWGTDSQEQIEEWILDDSDDPELCCGIDFIPFDGIVATEERSWSEVKGMFRETDR